LSVTPAPGTRHQSAVVRFIVRIDEHVRSRGLGKVFVAPTDCILSNTTVVQPDVLYVARDRLTMISERGIEGPPTLAIEILSPSTVQTDRDRKLRLYAEHGVLHYWIADPESRSVEGYTLADGVYVPAGRITSARGLASILRTPLGSCRSLVLTHAASRSFLPDVDVGVNCSA